MTVVHDNLEKTEAKMSAEAVSVFYGDKKAINEVSIDIPTEYVTAFIGPSGCGKSTFLRTLNRMNDTIPSARVEGCIKLDGDDIYASGMDVVQLRARVGMVFQKPNPFPKSIYDNVGYGPRIHGLAPSKADLDVVVERALVRAGLPTHCYKIYEEAIVVQRKGGVIVVPVAVRTIEAPPTDEEAPHAYDTHLVIKHVDLNNWDF